MTKVLVIGGGGFIGSNLCEALLETEHDVRVFERPNSRSASPAGITSRLEWFEGDMGNSGDVDLALEGQGCVFHLVSTTLPKTSNDDPGFDVLSNVVGTIKLLERCCVAGIKRVIFISSGGTVYGRPQTIPIPEEHPTEPLSSYGISKLTIEKYLELFRHLHGLEYFIFRLANPYGRYQRPLSSQGAVAVFLGRALNREPIEIWGDGEIVRDYIHIFDVTAALVRAVDHAGPSRIYNLGTGEGVSLNALIAMIDEVVGWRSEVVYMPQRSLDVAANILQVSRIKKDLAWRPTVSLPDGLRMTRDFLLSGSTVSS